MLDANIKQQLQSYLGNVTQPFTMIASLDDGDKSRELRDLLEEIAGMSDKISLRTDGQAERRPSFQLTREDRDIKLHFAGVPLGHEFTSLVLALLQTGGHPPKVDDQTLEQVKALEGDFRFETYYSLSCQNCPDVVQALNLMAIFNPNIEHVAIDGAIHKAEVDQREVMSVPSVYLNGEFFEQGRMTLEEIVNKLDTGAAERDAEKMNAKDAFDVLVIGGGPAGAASAIYTARKGIRTGIAAERFGGQVQDTNAIENFISELYTEGPKLAGSMEAHVGDYDIDLMNLQRAEKLIPAGDNGLHEVQFSSGASLRAKSLILSTGARWRQIGVPGEEEYRNKGVAYCPHCDGPLFKGREVAVIGGGNSGVEAAIDLAGLVEHVTVLEFEDRLLADDVLQQKLHSMANVTVLTNAQTTEITGDGSRVDGLSYTDRQSGETHRVELAGVFIQIGLVPNTEWLEGTVAMTDRGEIHIDERCATSIPGVFAAGDVTTVPYKQIVIAMGEGSKAGLSAFDHLIRQSVAEGAAEVA